tara:strand:+ start:314 stop:619 length:306 start_codon:yes stop_codon:yes gene_type:complete
MDSKTQVEIETTCKRGLDAYLSEKHQEFRRERLEEGLLGSLVGVVLTLGITRLEGFNLKPIHAIFPALAGVAGGVVVAEMFSGRDDSQNTEDFSEVCDSYL